MTIATWSTIVLRTPYSIEPAILSGNKAIRGVIVANRLTDDIRDVVDNLFFQLRCLTRNLFTIFAEGEANCEMPHLSSRVCH